MHKLEAGRVSLRSMDFFGYHGCLPEERQTGQRYQVDADFYFDFGPAAKSDELAKTVDYSKVYAIAKEVIEGAPRNLIETLAYELAAKLLTAFGPDRVAVRVRKPSPPVGGEAGYAEAEAVLSDRQPRREGKKGHRGE